MIFRDNFYYVASPKDLSHVSVAEFELIKFNLAKCAGEVESACVKQFAVETSDFVTRRCLDMLGAQTNLRDSPFQQFLAENQVLQSWQGSNNILKCFIAISGKSCAYLHGIFSINFRTVLWIRK
jgi:alkylation response protein AidB-like acyl-CoA dehydrogenase